MLSVFLFIVFFTAYAYLFVPSRPRHKAPIAALPAAPVQVEHPAADPLPDVTLDELVEELPADEVLPDVAIESTSTPVASAAKEMAPVATAIVKVIEPDYSQLTSHQLRKVCSKAGVKWRNVKGGRHLSKSEMIIRLEASQHNHAKT